MQAQPRKGNYTKFLKNLHTEQLAKLQLKNQHECDLLEDIRTFVIKRSAIEKSYSEALLKISSAYLNKKTPNIPEIKMDGADEKWNMWSVWTTVLEENEKLAKARLAAVEVFQQQIADEAKVLRSYKLGIGKKSVEYLGKVQHEVQISVQDVDKTKKSYFDEEHCAHDVRDKARDIEEKLKKKKGSFFQSITSLQKNSARVTSRKEQLEEKSTGARNDYILSLASANSHQNRYFTTDLQSTMATMENYVYERVADFLALIGRAELMTCSATQNSFGKIRDQANQLTREYNLQCCYLYYPVLKQHIQYEFEPCDNDPVRKVTADQDSVLQTLNQEGKRWAARVARESHAVRENTRRLASFQALRDAGHRSDPNDQNGPDLETKIEDLIEQIRKSEIIKIKAEARLECLKQGGISVEEWIQEAETLSVQEIPRSSSSLSMRTDASREGENPSSDSFYDSDNAEAEAAHSKPVATKTADEMRKEYRESIHESSEFEDDDIEEEPHQIEQFSTKWEDPTQIDWGNEKEEPVPPPQSQAPVHSAAAASGAVVPTFKCTALYSYTAQNPDELTIVESEQLEVVGDGDGDGWLRARNYRGEEGFVPHNYLDVERDVPTNEQQTQMAAQISFSSVDYTVDNEDQEVLPDSVQSPDQVSVISAPVKKKSDQMYCVALYDYDATAEDELTFEEGQIIKLITKEPHGVDDGWWEGELDGKFGNFPSLVVDECDENGEPLTEPEEEEDDEDDALPPAGFGLPPTVPPHLVPQDDFTASPEQQAAIEKKFEIDLSQTQQKQYKQFQAPTEVKMAGRGFSLKQLSSKSGVSSQTASETEAKAVEAAGIANLKPTIQSPAASTTGSSAVFLPTLGRGIGRGLAFPTVSPPKQDSDQSSIISSVGRGRGIVGGRGMFAMKFIPPIEVAETLKPQPVADGAQKMPTSDAITLDSGSSKLLSSGGIAGRGAAGRGITSSSESGSSKVLPSVGVVGRGATGRGIVSSSGRGTGSGEIKNSAGSSGEAGKVVQPDTPLKPTQPDLLTPIVDASHLQAQQPVHIPAPAQEVPVSLGAVPKHGSSRHSAHSNPISEPKTVLKHGSKGTEFNAMCNSIMLHCDPNKGVFEYEVRFNPQVDSIGSRSKYLTQHKETLGVARTFDGVTLFLPKELSTFNLVAKNPADDSDVKIEIIFKRKKRLAECIQLYNVLFDRIFRILNYLRVGRKCFDPTKPQLIPQHKLEIWPGYVKSVDEMEGGLMLSLDVSHRVLATRSVRDLMLEAYKSDKGKYQENIKKALVGKIVLTRYNNKTYRVDDIDFTTNVSDTFPQNDVEISFAVYYKKQYNITIEDLKQNLLVSRKEVRISGDPEKREYELLLVPELCFLTGLTDDMRSNFSVMKDLATHTKLSPYQRVLCFKQFVNNVNTTPDSKEVLDNWGLSLDPEPYTLKARMLGEEKIIFGRGKEFGAGPQADFSRHATSNQLLEPMDIQNWLLMFIAREKSVADAFESNVMKVSGPTGMRIAAARRVELPNDRTETFVGALRKELADLKTQIVVIIFPSLRDDRYAAVKRVLCSEIPTPSQVVNSKTLRNETKNRSIVQKIVLQMNCKLGGTLWGIKIPLQNTMICGIDTYHEKGHKGITVGGFIASLNAEFTRWWSRPTIQEKREELVNGLTSSMEAALTVFFNANNFLPDRIVLYRDGVGDGQLDFCKGYEVPQFLEAFKRVQPGYKPNLTYVIVQKRINTKFFRLVDGKTGKDGMTNPPPGSVLDHTITSKFLYDFYLVSQHVREGTTTPSHYIVLYDENNFDPDIMQKMTYKLTYLYYNWPGTVRVPAPCQYAHKLADLVGISVKRMISEKLASQLYFL